MEQETAWEKQWMPQHLSSLGNEPWDAVWDRLTDGFCRETVPAGTVFYQQGDPADEVLSVLTRELIAIAVAATTQCPYCLAGHVEKAKKAGATEEHLSRAIMVAAALRAGAAFTHGFLALKLYDQK